MFSFVIRDNFLYMHHFDFLSKRKPEESFI